MSLEVLVSQPSSLICLSRRPPRRSWQPHVDAIDEVTLRVLGGLGAEPLFVYPTDLDATVADVKEAIQRIEGTPAREQRLLAGGRQICSDGAGGSLNHLPLREALAHALDGRRSPEAAVDVTLVRVPALWAENLEGLQSGRLALRRLDETAKEDRELVLAAVSRCGGALAHASEALRADREVVLVALGRDPLALGFAAPSLQGDRKVVLVAVRSCGQALQHASEALRNDPEVVLAAMGNSWRALEHASPELRSDRSFVLSAVEEHGSALLFASPELRSSREVVLAAVRRSGWALSCASEELRQDRTCVLAAVESNPAALDFAAQSLREDPEVLSLVLSGTGRRVSTPCGRGPPAACALL